MIYVQFLLSILSPLLQCRLLIMLMKHIHQAFEFKRFLPNNDNGYTYRMLQWIAITIVAGLCVPATSDQGKRLIVSPCSLIIFRIG